MSEQHDMEAPTLREQALRGRYEQERERRVPAGGRQYQQPQNALTWLGEDPWTPKTEREPRTDRVEVLVMGGGFGGVLTGVRLREAGVDDICFVDEAGDFGGTWYWNRYPGIHCDIESYIYFPLLDEMGYVPKWRYAPGEEIRQYILSIVDRYELRRSTLFHTAVTELRWDDATEEWIVSTSRGDTIRARFVVRATGTLSTVKLPAIPGIESFSGHISHTSRWDYRYTGGNANGGLNGLSDKKVAMIGTGATAVQVLPHLVRDAKHVYVFQRTPSSVAWRGQRPTDPEWVASLEPGWAAKRRDNFAQTIFGRAPEKDAVNDAWTEHAELIRTFLPGIEDGTPQEQLDREREVADMQAMDRLRARIEEIVEDPATAELLKPWYRFMCKRPTFSDEYLQAFNQSNITLIDTAESGGVEAITEKGLVVNGVEYEVDAIVFATGFDNAAPMLLPIHGRNGASMLETWLIEDGPRSLHGFYSSRFPNLVNLGSLQNARSVNFTSLLDEQSVHAAAVIKAARSSGRLIEPEREVEEAWLQVLQASSKDVTAFQASCTPGYWNSEGEPNAWGEPYGEGPVAFHDLLRRWREEERYDEALGAKHQWPPA